MEWTIVTTIVVIVGLFISVGTPIIKLIQSIAKLNGTIELLNQRLSTTDTRLTDVSERNAKSHERIFDKLDDHEVRISVLEKKEE